MRERIWGLECETGFWPFSVYQCLESDIWKLIAKGKQYFQDGKRVVPSHLEFLANGSRLYKDSGHVEITTPECKTVRDLVRYDKANERILDDIVTLLNTTRSLTRMKTFQNTPAARLGCTFLKNSTGLEYLSDSHFASSCSSARNLVSYGGSHINILGSARETTVDKAMKIFAPFLLGSRWFTGSGLVWVKRGGLLRFSLSERSHFVSEIVGQAANLEKKPMFALRREEPLADRSLYFRVHIVGIDASMCEWPIYVLNVILGILMRMIESGVLKSTDYTERTEVKTQTRLLKMQHAISWWGHEKDEFVFRGERLNVAELHRKYYLEPILSWKARGAELNEEEEDGLRKYMFLLDTLEAASSSRDLAERLAPFVNWAAKLSYLILPDMDRYSYSFETRADAPLTLSAKNGKVKHIDAFNRLKLFDTFYHDVRRRSGFYHKLAEAGLIERIVTDGEISSAKEYPPRDTRARSRMERIKYLAHNASVYHISENSAWDEIKYTLTNGDTVIEENNDPFQWDPGAFRIWNQ